MNVPSTSEMTKLLGEKLAENYPDDCVELGEQWELIAEIFYKLGFAAANAEAAP